MLHQSLYYAARLQRWRGGRASGVRDAVLQAELVQAHGHLLGGGPLRRLQLHAVVDERRRLGAALVRHAAPRARAPQRHAQAGA
jgi:hypothetical protein